MNERAVLRELKAGDTGALSEIIGFYTPYLYTVASNIMDPPMSREDVEETVSDTFVRLWEHRGEVMPGKLKPWLAAVVRNCAKDVLRSHRLNEPLEDDVLDIAVPYGMEEGVLRAELTARLWTPSARRTERFSSAIIFSIRRPTKSPPCSI